MLLLVVKRKRKVYEARELPTVQQMIPASRSGKGRVALRVQGAWRELDAMTDDTGAIDTGTIVTITSIQDNEVLIVARQT